MKVEESLNVTFDESSPPTKLSPLVDDDVCEEEAIERKVKVDNNNVENESIEVDEYIKEMLKKFGLEDSKPTKTPMSTEIKLTKDDEAESMDSTNIELLDHLKLWELIHRENAFVAIGNRDHVQASIALMLYCLEVEIPFNLAYFVVKRMDFYMERVGKVLPYNMILTRFFKNLWETMEDHPFDDRYILFLDYGKDVEEGMSLMAWDERTK
ncbi:hypothetical protein Tco_1226954 [Tanacetum coccineum]